MRPSHARENRSCCLSETSLGQEEETCRKAQQGPDPGRRGIDGHVFCDGKNFLEFQEICGRETGKELDIYWGQEIETQVIVIWVSMGDTILQPADV